MQVKVLGDIVDEEDSDCRAVVGASDGSEILLASGVPHLQFDCFVTNRQHSRGKFHTKRDLVLLVYALLHELSDYATLAHSCVAHHNEFKQIIELAHY